LHKIQIKLNKYQQIYKVWFELASKFLNIFPATRFFQLFFAVKKQYFNAVKNRGGFAEEKINFRL